MRVLLVDIHPHSAPLTPISLGNLAAVLRRDGHETRVLGLGTTTPFSPRGIRSLIAELAPDLIGFTAYQRNLFHVRAVAALAKRVRPACRVVLGGPQAMFMPDESLSTMPEVDFLARGEGELAIAAIAEAMDNGVTDEPIPGVTSRTADGGRQSGPPIAPRDDLDAYPSPWLSGVLDPADHEESILLTSRGCPHRCAFCITPATCGGSVRCHSVERVLADIEHVAQRGSGRLWFADPNFSFDEERLVRILEGIARRGLSVEMWIETRADMLSSELIGLLKRTGVHTVALGLESAVPRVLRRSGKALEPEQIREAVTTIRAAGIDVELFSLYGLPGETADDALATLDFVRGTGVDVRGNSNAQQMQLYFGSAISRRPAEHGMRVLRDDLPPHLAPGDEIETEWMTRRDIDRVRQAWRSASLDGGKRIVS